MSNIKIMSAHTSMKCTNKKYLDLVVSYLSTNNTRNVSVSI